MTKEEMKDFISSCEQTSIFLEEPDFESAIIGYDDTTYSIIYDFDKMVDYLVENDNMTSEEAIDFIEYNTIRAIPYMSGGARPIIVRSFY